MGLKMAQSLGQEGFSVTGGEISPDAIGKLRAAGGQGAASPAAAVRNVKIVVSVVVNAAQTEDILFGQDGVASTLAEGSVFVSSASMAPEIARRRRRGWRRPAGIIGRRRSL